MNTRHGKLACAWEIKGNTFTANLTIPPNTTASVTLPVTGAITENGQPLAGKPGVLSAEGNRLTLGSGIYQLSATR